MSIIKKTILYFTLIIGIYFIFFHVNTSDNILFVKNFDRNIKDNYIYLHFNNIKLTNSRNSTDKTKEIYVKKGDVLSKILRRNKINVPNSFSSKKKMGCLARINIGQKIKVKYRSKSMQELRLYQKDGVCIYKVEESVPRIYKNKPQKYEKEIIAFGEITSSFFESAKDSGLLANEIMAFADVFGWDIDFALDIRKGDKFAVVVNRTYYGKNSKIKSEIKTAIFKNRKKIHTAIKYKNEYYNFEGRSLRKQFVRAPLDFYRISSHFNLKRKHPILHKIRAHKGTDYAAPTGTPVYATGDGTIIHRGRKGGYGKTVIIKHGNIYTTLYGHLSRYRRGQRVGTKVRQKQVIGYVGSTGLSTGPHLHYEFRVRGVHKNPVKVKFKKSRPISKKEKKKFFKTKLRLKDKINWIKNTIHTL
tara:strand:- start:6465 stop:7712 length:1248 start_codon:yes stop_codon:yes gene_type:complete